MANYEREIGRIPQNEMSVQDIKKILIAQRLVALEFSPDSEKILLPGHEPLKEVDSFYRSRGYYNYICFRLSELEGAVKLRLETEKSVKVAAEVVHVIGTIDVSDIDVSDDTGLPQYFIEMADFKVSKGDGHILAEFAGFNKEKPVDIYLIKTKQDIIRHLERKGEIYTLPGHEETTETSTYQFTGYDNYFTYDKEELMFRADFYLKMRRGSKSQTESFQAFVVHTEGKVNENMFTGSDDHGTDTLKKALFSVTRTDNSPKKPGFDIQFIDFVPLTIH